MSNSGTWVKIGEFVGVVVASDLDADPPEVTVFNPGDRQQLTVPAHQTRAVPTRDVRVVATATLPLPHGWTETTVRRWLAVLTDPVLQSAAIASLQNAGLDPDVMDHPVSFDVIEQPDTLSET